jgi:pre-mRNA-splicing factor CWC22
VCVLLLLFFQFFFLVLWQEDPNFLENEEKYAQIKAEILGEDGGSGSESDVDGDDEDGSDDEDADENEKPVATTVVLN